jgi:hypothetical protein
MRLAQPVVRYLIDVIVLHLFVLEPKSFHPQLPPKDLGALFTSAIKLSFVSNPIHELKQKMRPKKSGFNFMSDFVHEKILTQFSSESVV